MMKKLLGITMMCWMLSISAMGVLAQVEIDPANAEGNSLMMKTLANGSAQAVLAVVAMALGAAVIWLARQVAKIQEERIAETKSLLSDVVSKNSAALQRVADTIDRCEKK